MVDLKQRAGDEDSGAKEKAERDARWVGDWSDELTVAIALREWENAVVLVEEGQSRCPSQTENPFLSLTQKSRQSQTGDHPTPHNQASRPDTILGRCASAGTLVPHQSKIGRCEPHIMARATAGWPCGSQCISRIPLEGHIQAYTGN